MPPAGPYPSREYPMLAHELVIAGTATFPEGEQHLFSHLLSPMHEYTQEGCPARILTTCDPDPEDPDFEVETHTITIRRPRTKKD
jgi:hypothetical protein